MDFNAGYLNVSLRVLTSSGLIINNNDKNELKRIYKTNNNLIKITRSIKKLDELDEVVLYHKKFKKLHYNSLIEYTNLVYKRHFLPSVLPKYSRLRLEYFGRTLGSILLLLGVFISNSTIV